MFRVVLCFVSVITYSIGRNVQWDIWDRDPCEGGTRRCTILYECSRYMNEIKRYGKMSNALMNEFRHSNCGYVDKTPKVCCESARKNHIEGQRDVKVTSNLRNNWYPKPGEHKNLRLLPTKCGEFDDDRIIGGTTTELNSLPWMVQLIYLEEGRGTSSNYCGGTLISDRYVLTAAHCILFRGDRILHQVVLGEHDTRTNPDCYEDSPNKCFYAKKMTINEEDVKIHEKYSRRNNDIALIRLPERANLSLDNIGAICLPTTSELRDQALEGSCALVAGWGIVKQNSAAPSTVLQRARLPVISNKECSRILYKNMSVVPARQICTGVYSDERRVQCDNSHAVDTCQGDSGGPLAYTENVTGQALLVQWGIISFGGRECAKDVPTVHTRVSEYMTWILDNIRE